MKEQKQSNGHATATGFSRPVEVAAPQPEARKLPRLSRVYTQKAIMCGGRTETTLHKIPGLSMWLLPSGAIALEIMTPEGVERGGVGVGNVVEYWYENSKTASPV